MLGSFSSCDNVFDVGSQEEVCLLYRLGLSIEDMCRFHLTLFVSLLSLSSALRTVSPKSWDDAIAEAEVTLARECGNECVAVLRSVVNASGTDPNVFDNGGNDVFVLNSMSRHGLDQMEKAHDLMQSVSVKAQALTSPNVGQMRGKDTACGTPAECELRELAVNMRNDIQRIVRVLQRSTTIVALVDCKLSQLTFRWRTARCIFASHLTYIGACHCLSLHGN